jgi:alkanesulfonate monooxygenase SsuD/methylene tetrahydromethanopterin reductase-like flavin-dependent oxidoreductase (luciferase family)
MVYDDILRSGIHLFGSVETVTKKLCALADMGVDHVMTMQNFGNMAPAYVTNSMRLLSERVMPQVRQRQASRSLRGVA